MWDHQTVQCRLPGNNRRDRIRHENICFSVLAQSKYRIAGGRHAKYIHKTGYIAVNYIYLTRILQLHKL